MHAVRQLLESHQLRPPGRLAIAALAWLLVAVALPGAGERLPSPHALAALERHLPKPSPGVACPGADPCPYRAVSYIGQRGEGVLRYPEALAMAPDGDVYVADQYSFLVQRFSAQGRYLGEWGEHGSGPGQFGSVGAIAVGPEGEVYLVDSSHDRIEVFDPGGRFVREWGGSFDFGGGSPGVPPGGGIAVAGSYVYVSDTGNDRIERFTLDGDDPVVWGRGGGHPGELCDPRGFAVHEGALYVADGCNDRIEVFGASGAFERAAGSFGEGPGQYESPFDVAVSRSGAVFVADDNNHRVVRLDTKLAYEASWPVETVEGTSEGLHPNYGGEQVSYPRAVAVSAAGVVYVADAASARVDMYSTAGVPLGSWGRSARSFGEFMLPEDVAATPVGGSLVDDSVGRRIEGFDARRAFMASLQGGSEIVGEHLFKPVALALAPDGSVWVSDQENGLVRHLSADGELLGTLGGHAPAERLRDPAGVAVGSGGEVYVADTGEALLRRFSPSGRPLGRWGEEDSAPDRLRAPVALAVAPSGEVYVADAGADRVVRFDADGHFLGAWGGEGSAAGRMLEPDGLAIDSRGDVFVAEAGNDRIAEFTSQGRLQREWGAAGGGPGELSGPAGLAVDCTGALLVADTYNNRVARFEGVAPPGHCDGAEA